MQKHALQTSISTEDKQGWYVSLSLCPVPGQEQEQKFRDKLFCPGTSRDKITFPKKTKKQEKDVLKQVKGRSKSGKGLSKTGKGHSKTEKMF